MSRNRVNAADLPGKSFDKKWRPQIVTENAAKGVRNATRYSTAASALRSFLPNSVHKRAIYAAKTKPHTAARSPIVNCMSCFLTKRKCATLLGPQSLSIKIQIRIVNRDSVP